MVHMSNGRLEFLRNTSKIALLVFFQASYNKIRAMNFIAKMGIKPPPGFITAIPPMSENNVEAAQPEVGIVMEISVVRQLMSVVSPVHIKFYLVYILGLKPLEGV